VIFNKPLFYKYNPAVNKEYLLLPAGFMWMGVGIMLISFAFRWLRETPDPLPFMITGLAAGVAVYRFGFLKIALKNINRIRNLEGKHCFFSFITFRSYTLILFMIGLGITLRHSHIPRQWLSMIYNAIGIGLTMSSLYYFSNFYLLKKRG